jgi:hypothetical protein
VKADDKQSTGCSSETSVDFQRTTRRYIPEDGTLQLSLYPNTTMGDADAKIYEFLTYVQGECVSFTVRPFFFFHIDAAYMRKYRDGEEKNQCRNFDEFTYIQHS